MWRLGQALQLVWTEKGDCQGHLRTQSRAGNAGTVRTILQVSKGRELRAGEIARR